MIDKTIAIELDVLMDGVAVEHMSLISDIRHYIYALLRENAEKEAQLLIFKNELSKVHHNRQLLPHHRPLDIPTSRGTTHGQLMQMQHEAETMHDNPPHGQPMG